MSEIMVVNDVNAVSEDLWSSMVRLVITPAETSEEPPQSTSGVIAIVQIVGGWQGAVRIDLGLDLARHATAGLLGMNVAEVTDEEVRDAAGELANMTGGGIKALLPVPCSLSLPAVAMGSNFEFSVPHGGPVQRTVFDTPHGPFSVTILEGRA